MGDLVLLRETAFDAPYGSRDELDGRGNDLPLSLGVLARIVGTIAREPPASANGAEPTVTIEIEAIAPDGVDDAKFRTVSENATTLKFEQSGFEEG